MPGLERDISRGDAQRLRGRLLGGGGLPGASQGQPPLHDRVLPCRGPDRDLPVGARCLRPVPHLPLHEAEREQDARVVAAGPRLLQHPDGRSRLSGPEPGERDAQGLLRPAVQRGEAVQVGASPRLGSRLERELAGAQQHVPRVRVALERPPVGSLGLGGAARGLKRLAESAQRLGVARIHLHGALEEPTRGLRLAAVQERHPQALEARGVVVQIGERLHRAHRLLRVPGLERHLGQEEIGLLLPRREAADALEDLAGSLRPVGLEQQSPEEEQRRDVVRPSLEQPAHRGLRLRGQRGPGLGLGEREHQLGTARVRRQRQAELLHAARVLALEREQPRPEEVRIGGGRRVAVARGLHGLLHRRHVHPRARRRGGQEDERGEDRGDHGQEFLTARTA